MNKLLALVALLVSTGVANAQQADRYSLQKTADGYVRLNNETGEMSICKEQGEQLVCRVAADDRAALEETASNLEGRLAKIEQRLAALEQSGSSGNNTMPTDEEFEKTMGYMEKFFRRFMGVVKDLNEPQAVPDKT